MQKNKYLITIVKTAQIEVDGDDCAAAMEDARCQEAGGSIRFAMTVNATPILIAGKLPVEWAEILEREHGVSIYEQSEPAAGLFGYTGCEADDYTSEGLAIEAAMHHVDLMPGRDSNPRHLPDWLLKVQKYLQWFADPKPHELEAAFHEGLTPHLTASRFNKP